MENSRVSAPSAAEAHLSQYWQPTCLCPGPVDSGEGLGLVSLALSGPGPWWLRGGLGHRSTGRATDMFPEWAGVGGRAGGGVSRPVSHDSHHDKEQS